MDLTLRPLSPEQYRRRLRLLAELAEAKAVRDADHFLARSLRLNHSFARSRLHLKQSLATSRLRELVACADA